MITITTPNAHLDGISVFGLGSEYDAEKNVLKGQNIVITDTVVDFETWNDDDYDGGIDCVDGCNVTIRRCIVRNVGKAMLCGSEDMPKALNSITIEDSILEDNCRRNPEAQFNTQVTLRRCLIRNWGNPSRFTVRSFGAWAHHGGRIYARDCVFWQDRFFNGRFWRDLIGHIGQAFNDRSTRLRDYLLPGVCRGLTAGPGGYVEATRCYANRWWIQIEGRDGKMGREQALELIAKLERIRP